MKLDTSNWEAAYCYKIDDKNFTKPCGDLMPWSLCNSAAEETKTYDGIPPGHKNGVFGQFPEVDWNDNLDPVMEQIWAIGLGHAEMPVPKFYKQVRYVRTKPK